MTLEMLEQNVEILSEVSQNYKNLIGKKRIVKDKKEIENINTKLISYKKQLLYLSSLVKKLVDQEKNAGWFFK